MRIDNILTRPINIQTIKTALLSGVSPAVIPKLRPVVV
jgi:hypothetical protein